MAIVYPAGLPLGLKGTRSVQLVDPTMRSQLTSGRSRVRRKASFVPETYKFSWIFTDLEAQAFIAWYRDQLIDGVQWFDMPIDTPMGLMSYPARFFGVYSGPNPISNTLWSISADIELRERAAPPIGEGEFPQEILDSFIFDLTMNREWPQA